MLNQNRELIERLDRIEAMIAATASPWLTFDEACRYAKVSPGTLRKWLSNGLIAGSRTTGDWRIERASIDDFFRHGQVE